MTSGEGITTRALRRLARVVWRFPRFFFYSQALLFVLATGYTVQNLQIQTSRNALVGSDKKYHRIFLEFRREFPKQDDLVAVVESEDLEKNRQFVERLGARMSAETNLFLDVLYNNDVKMLGTKALLFFSEENLRELRRTLEDYHPFLEQFSRATNLNSLFRLVNRQFRTAADRHQDSPDSLLKALPALERIVLQAQDSLRRPGIPPSPGLGALFNAGEEATRRQYITFDRGRIFVVTAHAADTRGTRRAIDRMRELVNETQAEVPGVNVAITGEPVLEVDEMNQSARDTALATVVSLILCGLIFIYGYRETGRPLKAVACLLVGLAFTMGYATLVIGHLNILTITFAPMLIGLAIDFGVHLTTRYEEELRHGATVELAMEKAIVNTGQGIFTGCLTTAGAFFAMAFSEFKGVKEMGIITGGGMVLCLVPMMTLLPVLLRRGSQNAIDRREGETDHRAWIERIWLGRPKTVLAVTSLLCFLSALQWPKIHFDYNLLNMQTRDLPAVVFERKLIDTSDKSVLFGAVVADSLPEAVLMEAKLKALPSVASVDSMAAFLAENQAPKLEHIRAITNLLASIPETDVDPLPVAAKELGQTLTFLRSYLGLALDAMRKAGDTNFLRQVQSLGQAVAALTAAVSNGDPIAIGSKLAAYQQALFGDIQQTFTILRSQEARPRLTPEDLPAALRNRFIGVSGKHLLQVNPRYDVWRRDKQEEFVRDLRRIVPDVTGTPVQLLEYTTLLKDSYVQAAWYALGAIALLVFIHFRQLSRVILALLPVAMGSLWMVGFMGVFGIPFNPANIMTLPLVIGIGVTNGIHILNRFAEENDPGILSKSTGKAVLVSGLTTIAGFGSLTLADHQGIQTLGYVMAVGTATCMIAGMTFLPAVLKLSGAALRRKSTD
ncbi:MAG: RND transporter [Verrucomicrobia bacterium]|nr:RND transporter [Verrucomicrobiota bacterium]